MSAPAPSDLVEAAICRVKDGRYQEYETIVRTHQARLRALLGHSVPPGIDADELAHQTFVEAFHRLHAYTPGANFFAWLTGIARNLLLMELRRTRNEGRKHVRYARHLLTAAIEADLAQGETLDETRVHLLRSCLADLPQRMRAVVEMRYAEGVPLQTIAERVGKSLAAVKFQLFDVRRRLRDCVERKSLAEER